MKSPYANAIILRGDRTQSEQFVKDYIKENSVSSFNVFEYKDPLKILEVAQIKKILNVSSLNDNMRLFIFYADPTLIAQNALLKTLEELAEDVTFIFLEQKRLIPTIESRARILSFTPYEVAPNSSFKNMFSEYPLIFSEKQFLQKGDINFSELILYLRILLFESIKKDNIKNSNLILKLLKSYSSYISLIENNNLNKRLLFERVLIKCELDNAL